MQLILSTFDTSHLLENTATTKENELVYSTCKRVKEALLALEQLIAYTLTKVTKAGSTVDYVAWLRAEKKISRVKEKVRSAKNDLLLATSITSS